MNEWMNEWITNYYLLPGVVRYRTEKFEEHLKSTLPSSSPLLPLHVLLSYHAPCSTPFPFASHPFLFPSPFNINLPLLLLPSLYIFLFCIPLLIFIRFPIHPLAPMIHFHSLFHSSILPHYSFLHFPFTPFVSYFILSLFHCYPSLLLSLHLPSLTYVPNFHAIRIL